jgi:putative RecB family exonuclease
MVDNWIKWRAQSGWRVWTTPDGQPAIELSQEFKTPSGRDIKGYIDRIMIEAETKELVIVDLKSGARSPESDLQLGFYRYEMWNTYGVDI